MKKLFSALLIMLILFSGCIKSNKNELKDDMQKLDEAQKEMQQIMDNIDWKSMTPEEQQAKLEELEKTYEQYMPDEKQLLNETEKRTEQDCESISDIFSRGSCFYNIAVRDHKIMLCKKAEKIITDCLLEVDKDKDHSLDQIVKVCQSHDMKINRHSCFKRLARHRDDISLCSYAEDNFGSCLVEVDSNKDHEINELTKICGDVQDSFDRGECFKKIAVHRKQLSLCKKAVHYVDSCAVDVDIKKDHSIEELSEVCNSEAVQSAERSADLRDESGSCFYAIASHRNNFALCQKASGLETSCAQQVDQINPATIEQIKSLCMSITENTQRSFCFHTFGTIKNSAELCELSGNYKDICLQAIS